VLSGFVMALAYTSRIKKNLHFKAYFILRLGRIYPLHLTILLLWGAYILLRQLMYVLDLGGFDQFAEYHLGSFVSHVFLISSIGVDESLSWNYPAWSISAEFFAYIAFYWLTVFLDKKDSILFAAFISVSCYLSLIYLVKDNIDVTYDYGFLRCLAAFYVGVLVLRVHQMKKDSGFIRENLFLLEFLCLVGCVVSVSFVSLHLLYFIPVIAIFAFAIYVFSHEESGFLGRLLLLTPFRKIGLWSYSIYMLHAIVLEGVFILFQSILKWDVDSISGFNSLIINSLILIMVIFISRYFYVYVESLFRSRSRKLAEKYK
jgi:peptidoglycan/LPS O-acetylase OafA/YrhL